MDVLFEQELAGASPGEILKRYHANPGYVYAEQLVNGVNEHRSSIDRTISAHAKDWKLERMPVVDRNLLRIAIFEMGYLPEVPVAVAMNEAVELAKTYSTEDSSRFVNGLLAAVCAQGAVAAVDKPPSTV